MKHLKFIGVLSTLIVAAATMIYIGNTNAYDTQTTLAITAGTFDFYKDTGASMDSYFGHSANTASNIDIGSYTATLNPIAAASSGNHRFTVSDMLGSGFTVSLQSSDLTSTNGTIAKANVSYTGTDWMGTGVALTAAATGAADIGTAPVTFVARQNFSGLSLYSQEITIKVAVPAAQAPGTYTGLLTFTY